MAVPYTEWTKHQQVDFTPQEIEKFERLGNIGLNAYLANIKNEDYNADGKPWKLELQRPDLDLKVYSSEAVGTSFRRFKAVCIIPCTPIEFYNLVVDFKYRLTWDRNVQHITALKVQDISPGRNKITISRSATKPVGPISCRDFIDCMAFAELPNGMIAQGSSGVIDDPKFPPMEGYVRGYNNAGSGISFEWSPSGGTKTVYLIHSDLKGWFLPAIVNSAIGGSFVSFFEDARKALRNHNPSVPKTLQPVADAARSVAEASSGASEGSLYHRRRRHRIGIRTKVVVTGVSADGVVDIDFSALFHFGGRRHLCSPQSREVTKATTSTIAGGISSAVASTIAEMEINPTPSPLQQRPSSGSGIGSGRHDMLKTMRGARAVGESSPDNDDDEIEKEEEEQDADDMTHVINPNLEFSDVRHWEMIGHERVRSEATGITYVARHYRATLRSSLSLRAFPFDRHAMQLRFFPSDPQHELVAWGQGQGQGSGDAEALWGGVPRHWRERFLGGIAGAGGRAHVVEVSPHGWTLNYHWATFENPHQGGTQTQTQAQAQRQGGGVGGDGNSDAASGLEHVISWGVTRCAGYYVTNYGTVLFSVVLATSLGLALDCGAVAARSGLDVLVMLILIQLKLSMASTESLPKVAYPTDLDHYLVLCFVAVFCSLLQTFLFCGALDSLYCKALTRLDAFRDHEQSCATFVALHLNRRLDTLAHVARGSLWLGFHVALLWAWRGGWLHEAWATAHARTVMGATTQRLCVKHGGTSPLR